MCAISHHFRWGVCFCENPCFSLFFESKANTSRLVVRTRQISIMGTRQCCDPLCCRYAVMNGERMEFTFVNRFCWHQTDVKTRDFSVALHRFGRWRQPDSSPFYLSMFEADSTCHTTVGRTWRDVHARKGTDVPNVFYDVGLHFQFDLYSVCVYWCQGAARLWPMMTLEVDFGFHWCFQNSSFFQKHWLGFRRLIRCQNEEDSLLSLLVRFLSVSCSLPIWIFNYTMASCSATKTTGGTYIIKKSMEKESLNDVANCEVLVQ